MAKTPPKGWQNPSARPTAGPARPLNYEQLAQRLREVEALCADVYVAAVEVGLPQPLLNRLWVVAGQGAAPQAFAIDGDAAMTQATTRTVTEPAPDKPPLTPLPRRRTVLVVDDDEMMMEVLVRILKRENYELLTANSGPAAIREARTRQTLDLLVTDVMMPGMTGPQLADQLRQKFPDLPVLYQTGFSDMLFDDRVHLDERTAFLEKPFTARGLMEAARMVQFGQLNPQ